MFVLLKRFRDLIPPPFCKSETDYFSSSGEESHSFGIVGEGERRREGEERERGEERKRERESNRDTEEKKKGAKQRRTPHQACSLNPCLASPSPPRCYKGCEQLAFSHSPAVTSFLDALRTSPVTFNPTSSSATFSSSTLHTRTHTHPRHLLPAYWIDFEGCVCDSRRLHVEPGGEYLRLEEVKGFFLFPMKGKYLKD